MTELEKLPIATLFALDLSSKLLSHSILTPFNRVQYVMQAHHEHVRTGRVQATPQSAISCTKNLLLTEGPRSLWRGFIAGYLCVAATSASSVVFQGEKALDLLGGNTFASATIFLLISSPLSYPFKLFETKFSSDVKDTNGKYRNKSYYNLAKTIKLNNEGFYRGFLPFMFECGARNMTALGSVIMVNKSRETATTGVLFMSLYCVLETLLYPVETARVRYVISGGEKNHSYANFFDAFKSSWALGRKSMYAGFSVCAAKFLTKALLAVGLVQLNKNSDF